MFDLYLVTDPDVPGGVVEATLRALCRAPTGRVGVQLRDKAADDATLERLAAELREVTRAAGAPLLVNGRPEIARRTGADGVQLPEGSPPPDRVRAILGSEAWVGVSCHDVAGARRAAEGGATFAVAAPFGRVPGKGSPLGPPGLSAIVRSAGRLPVLALGGIGPARIAGALAAGASGVAVMRAVWAAPDPAAAVVELLRSLDTARGSGR